MTAKYKLVDKQIIAGNTFFRVQALIDIPKIGVKKGDKGGFVQSEHNLSHEGNCWIFDNSIVSGKASMRENATIHNVAIMYGDATASGQAMVRDSATITDCAIITDNVIVLHTARVAFFTHLSGNVLVGGKVELAFNRKALVLDGNIRILNDREKHLAMQSL